MNRRELQAENDALRQCLADIIDLVNAELGIPGNDEDDEEEGDNDDE